MTPPLEDAAVSATEKEYTGASRRNCSEGLVGAVVVISKFVDALGYKRQEKKQEKGEN
jgi:hypothetical protein